MRTTETKYTCDKCGCCAPRAATTTICIGREMDPSGHGYESDMRDVDLCARCLHDLVHAAWTGGMNFRSLPTAGLLKTAKGVLPTGNEHGCLASVEATLPNDQALPQPPDGNGGEEGESMKAPETPSVESGAAVDSGAGKGRRRFLRRCWRSYRPTLPLTCGERQ